MNDVEVAKPNPAGLVGDERSDVDPFLGRIPQRFDPPGPCQRIVPTQPEPVRKPRRERPHAITHVHIIFEQWNQQLRCTQCCINKGADRGDGQILRVLVRR